MSFFILLVTYLSSIAEYNHGEARTIVQLTHGSV